MNGTTGPRLTKERNGRDFAFPVAANVTCHAGAIAVLKETPTGVYVQPATTGSNLRVVGVFNDTVVNDSVAGAVSASVRRGTFHFLKHIDHNGDDWITLAHVGQHAYLVDDQTVALTDNFGNRSPAGIIRDVDGAGVWIEI